MSDEIPKNPEADDTKAPGKVVIAVPTQAPASSAASIRASSRTSAPVSAAHTSQAGSSSCGRSTAIALSALVISILALAMAKINAVPTALEDFFTGVGKLMTVFTWDAKVASLLCVMSLCGAVGALAQRIVSADIQKSNGERTDHIHRPWWSWAGSLLVGAVAANVLHFPLAAVFNYDQLLLGGPKGEQPFLSLIALALLAGYTGPTLLDALAKKFQDSVAAKLEERLKRKEDILDGTLRFLLQDILTRRINPNATDCELLRAKYEEVLRVEAESGDEALSALDAVVAGYYSLEQGRYRDAVRYLENADNKISELTTDGQKWAAKNLLALAYQYDYLHQRDWFKKAADKHAEALKADPTPVQEAITHINLAYAMKDNGDLSGAKSELKIALIIAKNFPADFATVRDVAYLCLANILTREAQEKAEKIPVDLTAAIEELNKIQKPDVISYLFEDDSIEVEVLEAWRTEASVPTEIKELLS